MPVAVIHDFDWYVDRLDLARWESQDRGSRSGFFNCPIHGGSDSLHVTEKNGKALLNCFACQAAPAAITEALESLPESTEDEEPVTIKRGGERARRGRKLLARPSADAGSIPATSTTSPLEWMAERCGLTSQQLAALNLPLSEEGSNLVFEFPGANGRKLRGVGEGKKDKRYSWSGANSPPLWPLPAKPGAEIVVCEGEADVICLIASGIEAYSITKGSQGEVPAAVWDSLRQQGVEVVRLVFDMDEAGRKGRDAAVSAVRQAGMLALPSRVIGIDVLAGEKDARDVALRLGYPLALEDDADEDDAVLLLDQEFPDKEPLWLERIHPQEHTILYGAGGTGKGVVAAWWVARLTREGKTVLVLDYEHHAQYEWGPRLTKFGADSERVFYAQPVRPIWDISGWVRTQVVAHSADLVVVDSALYACVGIEPEKAEAAIRYSMAIADFGVPVLTLAHVTKEDGDPHYPFGSVFWHNGARVTISVSQEKPEDPASRRILRNWKTNQRGPFRPRAINWDRWLDTEEGPGVPSMEGDYNTLEETDAKVAAKNDVMDAFIRLQATMGRDPTPKEVWTLMSSELGADAPTQGTVRVTLHRNRQDRPVTVTRTRRDRNVGTDMDARDTIAKTGVTDGQDVGSPD